MHRGKEAPLAAPPPQKTSRRVFLQQLAQVVGGSYLYVLAACRRPKPAAPLTHAAPAGGLAKPALAKEALPAAANLNPREVEICAAACDAILPPDEEPGAVQLGAVQYIDSRFDRLHEGPDKRDRFTAGLHALNHWTVEKEGREFPELAAEDRERVLTAYSTDGGPKARSFVTQLLIHTMEGTLADPTYGGNRDRAGWTLIGFQVPCPNPSCH